MKTIKNTILNQNMKVATNPGEAWTSGQQYFLAAEAEAYKNLDKEQISALLRSAATLQKETGALCLFEDPTMPSDARVDIIHKPTYAIAAIAIYAQLHFPEIFDEALRGFLHGLLEKAFCHGIIGHGIESEETVRRALLMLCKAGMRDFLDAKQEQFPIFTKAIRKHMKYYESLCKQIDEEHIKVTENGFSTESINHLIKELAAMWNGNTHPIFVYGTLMKGQRANHMLQDCEFAGHFQLKDYAMYNLGSFPGIKPCTGESVLGEIYFVNDEVLAQIDRYESEGSLYNRTPVSVHIGKRTFSAEAYVYNGDISTCQKMREPWNAAADGLVWYAGYGSNLSRQRFSCYISGGTCKENGRTYPGCSDPTPARAEQNRNYPGTLYFGNSSSSWGGCGVAFYDPAQRNEDDFVYMKLYLITRSQLHDVMKQEGASPNWYGRLFCLEVDDQGIPVYTLTSEAPRPKNTPAEEYTNLIADALTNEFKLGKKQASGYIKRWL